MQNIDALIKTINNLKILGIIGDIALPIVLIIAMLIVYFYQRKRIEVLQNYMDLWKPKELQEQVKAYIGLHERMTDEKLHEFERHLESERNKIESVENENKRLEKQYQVSISKKSDLEIKYLRLEMDVTKLRKIQLLHTMLTQLYSNFGGAQLNLIMYADLGLERKYPDAPIVRKAFDVVEPLQTSLSKYADIFFALSNFDVLKPEEISMPEEVENLGNYSREFLHKLRTMNQSLKPFLNRYFEQQTRIAKKALRNS